MTNLRTKRIRIERVSAKVMPGRPIGLASIGRSAPRGRQEEVERDGGLVRVAGYQRKDWIVTSAPADTSPGWKCLGEIRRRRQECLW